MTDLHEEHTQARARLLRALQMRPEHNATRRELSWNEERRLVMYAVTQFLTTGDALYETKARLRDSHEF